MDCPDQNIQSSSKDSPKSVLQSLSTLSPSSKETVCSICANLIPNYKPKYFLEEEINPVCTDCKDGSNDEIADKNPNIEAHLKNTISTEDVTASDEAESTTQPNDNLDYIVNEDYESYIVPKLPRLMTEAEKVAFLTELLAKYKLLSQATLQMKEIVTTQLNLNSSWD